MGNSLIIYVQLSLRNNIPVQLRYIKIYTRNNTRPKTVPLELETALSLFNIFLNDIPNSVNMCADELVNHLHFNATWCVYFGTLADWCNLRSSLSILPLMLPKWIIMPDQQGCCKATVIMRITIARYYSALFQDKFRLVDELKIEICIDVFIH